MDGYMELFLKTGNPVFYMKAKDGETPPPGTGNAASDGGVPGERRDIG